MHQPDAVIVLGGGVREGGELPLWVVARFDRALEVAGDAPIVCLSAGTVHKPPPLNAEGYPWLESVAGAAYLLGRDVPSSRIQVEALSYDTIGNAYFTKLVHVDPPGWRRLVVITSEFHMPRSKDIFEWIYGMGPVEYEIVFEATPDTGVDPVLLDRRRAKEADAQLALQSVKQKVRNLADLHRWFFAEHKAYTADGWVSRKASSTSIGEIY